MPAVCGWQLARAACCGIAWHRALVDSPSSIVSFRAIFHAISSFLSTGCRSICENIHTHSRSARVGDQHQPTPASRRVRQASVAAWRCVSCCGTAWCSVTCCVRVCVRTIFSSFSPNIAPAFARSSHAFFRPAITKPKSKAIRPFLSAMILSWQAQRFFS